MNLDRLRPGGSRFTTAVVSAVAAGLLAGPLLAAPAADAAGRTWQLYGKPGPHNYKVPQGVRKITAYVWGAGAGGGAGGGGGGGGDFDYWTGGGGGGAGGGGAGGMSGAYVECVLSVKPGQILTAYVGKGGAGGKRGEFRDNSLIAGAPARSAGKTGGAGASGGASTIGTGKVTIARAPGGRGGAQGGKGGAGGSSRGPGGAGGAGGVPVGADKTLLNTKCHSITARYRADPGTAGTKGGQGETGSTKGGAKGKGGTGGDQGHGFLLLIPEVGIPLIAGSGGVGSGGANGGDAGETANQGGSEGELADTGAKGISGAVLIVPSV